MNNALWYFGRGSGVSALLLLTLAMVLGRVVAHGRALPGLPRFSVVAVHRAVSLLATGFLALHVVTLLLDPYAQLRVFDVVVPFAGRFRPFWQGLGTVALDLVVLLVVTSLVRHRLGQRTWRAVHWAAYACWPVAVLHVVGNGTDRTSVWLLTIVAVCIVSVVGVLLVPRPAVHHRAAALRHSLRPGSR